MGKFLKNVEVITDTIYGVCLWKMPDGSYIGDEEGRFLSMQGKLYDPVIESRMRSAAKSFFGLDGVMGEPVWSPGSRQISDSEADDQMERLLEGRIPDVVDSVRQLKERGLA